VTADPFAGKVPAGAVVAVVSSLSVLLPIELVVVSNTSSFATVVSEPDSSELEPPHDATATRAIAKMAHLVTRDLI
jgi:hypothetical protein